MKLVYQDLVIEISEMEMQVLGKEYVMDLINTFKAHVNKHTQLFFEPKSEKQTTPFFEPKALSEKPTAQPLYTSPFTINKGTKPSEKSIFNTIKPKIESDDEKSDSDEELTDLSMDTLKSHVNKHVDLTFIDKGKEKPKEKIEVKPKEKEKEKPKEKNEVKKTKAKIVESDSSDSDSSDDESANSAVTKQQLKKMIRGKNVKVTEIQLPC